MTCYIEMILNASHSSEKTDCGSALCVSTSVGGGSRETVHKPGQHRRSQNNESYKELNRETRGDESSGVWG